MEISQVKTPKFSCENCHFHSSNKQDYTRHLSTAKHLSKVERDVEEMGKTQEKTPKFSCDICDFHTSNKQDYSRHVSTTKHVSRVKNSEKTPGKTPILSYDRGHDNTGSSQDHVQDSTTASHNRASDNDVKRLPKKCAGYSCGCGKIYAVYGSLWRHQKKCDGTPTLPEGRENTIRETAPEVPTSPTVPVFTAELVLALVSQNKELQNILIEQNNKFMEKMSLVTTANTMTNSHNNNTNTFNIHMYLNEQCKNAINLSDFVKNLNVTVQDLLRTAELGHVAGISSIFTNGLRELDVHTRPIHCTDLKRETVYVRDQDKWVKDDDDKHRIRQAIKQVTIKNFKQLAVWESENPECYNTNSNASDTYVVISRHALGGSGEEEVKAQNTIMKNVFKTVLVDK